MQVVSILIPHNLQSKDNQWQKYMQQVVENLL